MEKSSLSLSLQVLTVAAWNWLLKVMRTYSVVLFVLFTWIITPAYSDINSGASSRLKRVRRSTIALEIGNLWMH